MSFSAGLFFLFWPWDVHLKVFVNVQCFARARARALPLPLPLSLSSHLSLSTPPPLPLFTLSPPSLCMSAFNIYISTWSLYISLHTHTHLHTHIHAHQISSLGELSKGLMGTEGVPIKARVCVCVFVCVLVCGARAHVCFWMCMRQDVVSASCSVSMCSVCISGSSLRMCSCVTDTSANVDWNIHLQVNSVIFLSFSSNFPGWAKKPASP